MSYFPIHGNITHRSTTRMRRSIRFVEREIRLASSLVIGSRQCMYQSRSSVLLSTPTKQRSTFKAIPLSSITSDSPSRSFSSNITPDPDYEARAHQWGLASKDEVAKAATDPSTVWLDVRSGAEIEAESLTARPYVHCWCTMDDTSRLVEQANELLPDKDATVVIYCAVGGRASVAKQSLESMGYTKVLNAGGLKDLDYIQ